MLMPRGHGWLDERAVVLESLTLDQRAGARPASSRIREARAQWLADD